MPLTASNVSIAPEVGEFCAAHGLPAALETAVDHLGRAFPDAERITAEVGQDPDSHHRWVLLDVLMTGTAAEVHTAFTESALGLGLSLGWPACTLIHTTYTLTTKP
jgi:hypothetical protein